MPQGPISANVSRSASSPLTAFFQKLLRKRQAAWRYLRGGPSHLLMYTFGRFSPVRSAVLFAHRVSSAAPPVSIAPSLLDDVDADQAASLLDSHGLVTGLQLRPETLAELLRFTAGAACFADEDWHKPFDPSDRDSAEQRYSQTIRAGHLAVEGSTKLQGLCADPTLLSITRKYLGCEPAFLGSRIWWNFATAANAEQQMSLGQGFHYDLDGYKALAFFFYLTEVTPTTGPHICVPGSHKTKPLKSLLSLHKGRSDAEIEKWYGRDRQVSICGPAGSGFAEDIFCFHKGGHPETADRLILQLRYGLCNYDKSPG